MPCFRPLFAACLLLLSAHASAATPREVVDQVASTIEREYFDPQRAGEVAAALRADAAAGRYDRYAHPADLATALTTRLKAEDRHFNVRWSEQRFVNGAAAGTERWTAVLSIVLQAPRTEQRLRRNPLGIYVNGLSWSRELDTTTEGVKP